MVLNETPRIDTGQRPIIIHQSYCTVQCILVICTVLHKSGGGLSKKVDIDSRRAVLHRSGSLLNAMVLHGPVTVRYYHIIIDMIVGFTVTSLCFCLLSEDIQIRVLYDPTPPVCTY